ncbi:MAG: 5'/3'-nucleotidase SurE [Planctomycetes bacterium]|nr:5'/3'-nucleotidase SurE [Planctomycetota bacterium]
MTPRIVLTNDDGIDAPGLAALISAVGQMGETVVVAPMSEWSGCGHKVTTHAPIRCERRGDAYAVDGTPGDCIRVALHEIVRDAGWVLSGINAGGNLGADIVHSGTIAAAREAALHGRSSIAVSHYIRRGATIDWPRAARFAGAVIADLVREPPGPGCLWNVNLPHTDDDAMPPVVRCEPDPSPLPLAFRRDGDAFTYSGNYHQRARVPGSDVSVCFGGAISVSRIRAF